MNIMQVLNTPEFQMSKYTAYVHRRTHPLNDSDV